MEGGVVCSEYAAVEIGVQMVFLLYRSGMCILVDKHGECVYSSVEIWRDVGYGTGEGSLYTVYLLAVDPHIGFPVDAVEIQKHPLTGHLLRQGEGAAIPEVGVEI